MEIVETVILGVVSGIATTFTLFLASKFVTLWLIPQYQEWRYQGADISGTWIADIKEETGIPMRAKYSLNLIQHAHTLKGTLHFEFESEQNTFSTDFEASGEYWEGYFSIMFKSIDRKRFSRASMIMKLTNGGTSMQGHFSFRNVNVDNVSTVPLMLIRS